MGNKRETEKKVAELQERVNALQKQLRDLNNQIFLYQGRLVSKKENEIAQLNGLLEENTNKRNGVSDRINNFNEQPEFTDKIKTYDPLLKARDGNTSSLDIPSDIQEYYNVIQEFKDIDKEKIRLNGAIKERKDWIEQHKRSEADYDLSEDEIKSIEKMDENLFQKTLGKLCSQQFRLKEQIVRTNELLQQVQKVHEAFLSEGKETEEEPTSEIPEGKEAPIEAQIAFYRGIVQKIEAMQEELAELNPDNDPPSEGFMNQLNEMKIIVDNADTAQENQKELREKWDAEGISELYTDAELSAKHEDLLQTLDMQKLFKDGVNRIQTVERSHLILAPSNDEWAKADRLYDELNNGVVSLNDLIRNVSNELDRFSQDEFYMQSFVIAKYQMIHILPEDDPRRSELENYFNDIKTNRSKKYSLSRNENEESPIYRIKRELDEKVEQLSNDEKLTELMPKSDNLIRSMGSSDKISDLKENKNDYEMYQKKQDDGNDKVKSWITGVKNGAGYLQKVYNVAERFNNLSDDVTSINFSDSWDIYRVNEILEDEKKAYISYFNENKSKLAESKYAQEKDVQSVDPQNVQPQVPEEPFFDRALRARNGAILPKAKNDLSNTVAIAAEANSKLEQALVPLPESEYKRAVLDYQKVANSNYSECIDDIARLNKYEKEKDERFFDQINVVKTKLEAFRESVLKIFAYNTLILNDSNSEDLLNADAAITGKYNTGIDASTELRKFCSNFKSISREEIIASASEIFNKRAQRASNDAIISSVQSDLFNTYADDEKSKLMQALNQSNSKHKKAALNCQEVVESNYQKCIKSISTLNNYKTKQTERFFGQIGVVKENLKAYRESVVKMLAYVKAIKKDSNSKGIADAADVILRTYNEGIEKGTNLFKFSSDMQIISQEEIEASANTIEPEIQANQNQPTEVVNRVPQNQPNIDENAQRNQPDNTKSEPEVKKEAGEESFKVRADKAQSNLTLTGIENAIFTTFKRIENRISDTNMNYLTSQLPDSLYKEALLNGLPHEDSTINKYTTAIKLARQYWRDADETLFKEITNIKGMMVEDRKDIIQTLGCISALIEKDISVPQGTANSLKDKIESTKKAFDEGIKGTLTTFAPELKSITDAEIEEAKNNFINTIETRRKEMEANQAENIPAPQEENQAEIILAPQEENQTDNIQLPDDSVSQLADSNNVPLQDIVISENNIDTSQKPENDSHQLNQGEKEAALQKGIPTIRGKLLKLADELEKARSPFKNSKEYEKLTGAIRNFGSGNVPTEYKNLELEEQFAQELYTIHALTEKYLVHKANDGVNKNAYRKLCVVEETSKVLEDALQIIGETRLGYNIEHKDEFNDTNLPRLSSEMHVSLASRMEYLHDEVKNRIPKLEDADRDHIVDRYITANPPKKADNALRAKIGRVISDVDNCMCKILIKALDKPEASVDKSAVKSLQKMRQQFLQNPLPPMEEEPELKANQNNPVVNGLIH